MPHIIIEYSANIGTAATADRIVDHVHRAALASPIVPMPGLRTRAVQRDRYQVADGDGRNAFVAVMARFGPGRDAAAKREFIDLLLTATEEAVSAAAPDLDVSYSVEFQEIEAEFRVNRNHIRTRLEQQETPDEGRTSDNPDMNVRAAEQENR